MKICTPSGTKKSPSFMSLDATLSCHVAGVYNLKTSFKIMVTYNAKLSSNMHVKSHEDYKRTHSHILMYTYNFELT